MIKKFKKKYYCVKQHGLTGCGAACLATISKQHGLKIPITKIREIAGTDKQGTNAYGVIKAAEEIEYSAKDTIMRIIYLTLLYLYFFTC